MRCWVEKIWRFTGLLLLLFLLVAPMSAALSAEEGQSKMTQALDAQTQSMMKGIDLRGGFSLGDALLRIWKNAKQEVRQSWSAGIRSLARITVIAIACGAAQGLRGAVDFAGDIPLIPLAGVLGTAVCMLQDFSGMLALCRNTLDSLNAFSGVLLPTVAASVTLSGAPTRAALLHTAAIFMLDFMTRGIRHFLMPAVCLFLAVATVNCAIGQNLLGKFSNFILWMIKCTLKLSLTLFVAFLTLSGALGAGADGFAVKTAKTALSGAIPVVGGVMSDAAGTMLAGAAAVRNITGVFGILCVLAICLIPIARAGINYFLFKGGAAVLSVLCGKELSVYLESLSDAFGVLLGMIAACGAVLFFELVFAIMMIGGAG